MRLHCFLGYLHRSSRRLLSQSMSPEPSLVPKVEIPQSLENVIVEQRVGFSRRQAAAEGEQRQGGMIGAERTEHRGAAVVARSVNIDAVWMERGETYQRNRNRLLQQIPQFNGAAAEEF